MCGEKPALDAHKDFDLSNISCGFSSRQCRRQSFWRQSAPVVCLILSYFSIKLKEFSFFNCKPNIVFLFMGDICTGNWLFNLQQRAWTYWASSRRRIGWARLWRPPHRKVASGTGSGRSVRKIGHMAPSVMSGCWLSDCFLETHTYI